MGTITKALELLNYFSRSTPELGLGDFVRRSGRDKATVHRHLVELAENGFLEQHPERRSYRLGPALLRLSALREATAPVRSVLRPVVEAMADEVGELVHFSLLEGTALTPICHADPARHGTQVHFDDAERLPLHATSSGLAVLAFGPDALRRQVLAGPLAPHALHTITTPAALEAALDEIRRTGVSRGERSFDDEVSSQAVPVFDAEAKVIGALAIAVPLVRASEEKCARHAAALARAVARVSHALGGTIPDAYDALWQSELLTT